MGGEMMHLVLSLLIIGEGSVALQQKNSDEITCAKSDDNGFSCQHYMPLCAAKVLMTKVQDAFCNCPCSSEGDEVEAFASEPSKRCDIEKLEKSDKHTLKQQTQSCKEYDTEENCRSARIAEVCSSIVPLSCNEDVQCIQNQLEECKMQLKDCSLDACAHSVCARFPDNGDCYSAWKASMHICRYEPFKTFYAEKHCMDVEQKNCKVLQKK